MSKWGAVSFDSNRMVSFNIDSLFITSKALIQFVFTVHSHSQKSISDVVELWNLASVAHLKSIAVIHTVVDHSCRRLTEECKRMTEFYVYYYIVTL